MTLLNLARTQVATQAQVEEIDGTSKVNQPATN